MFLVSQYTLEQSNVCKSANQISTYSVALGLILYASIYLYLLFYNNEYLDIFNKFIVYIVIIDLLLSAFYYMKIQSDKKKLLKSEIEDDESDEDTEYEDDESDIKDDESDIKDESDVNQEHPITEMTLEECFGTDLQDNQELNYPQEYPRVLELSEDQEQYPRVLELSEDNQDNQDTESDAVIDVDEALEEFLKDHPVAAHIIPKKVQKKRAPKKSLVL
jgi:hypothetical protein